MTSAAPLLLMAPPGYLQRSHSQWLNMKGRHQETERGALPSAGPQRSDPCVSDIEAIFYIPIQVSFLPFSSQL